MKRWFRGKKPSPLFKRVRDYAWDIECFGLNPSEPNLIAYRSFEQYGRTPAEGYWTGRQSKEEFINFLHSLPKTKLHRFFAHNGNRFDIYAIFTAEEIVTAKKFSNGNRIFYIKYLPHVEFRDSKMLLSAPLKAFGAKGITPEKFINSEHPQYGDFDCIDDEDIEYCVQDCRVLVDALKFTRYSFREVTGHENADLPLTAASMAKQVWTALDADWMRWCKKDGEVVYAVEIDVYCDRIARKCGKGGKTWVREQAGEWYDKVFSLDANSLYPSVMRDNDYPNPKTMYRVKNDMEFEEIRERGMPYWGWFHLENRGEKRGFLPDVDDNGVRSYDNDVVQGYLCSPEVEMALEKGWVIVDRKDTCSCREVMRPFERFVNTCYEKRMEAKASGGPQYFWKILLNSGFGGFGMRPPTMRIEDPEEIALILRNKVPESIKNTEEATRLWSGEDWSMIFDAKLWSNESDLFYLEGKTEGKTPDGACYVWSSFVMCYGRVELQKAIDAMEEAGYSVVYTDTDSVHCSPFRSAEDVPLKIGSSLGEWDYESFMVDGEEQLFCDRALYWEKKAYVWEHDGEKVKVKHKGANRSNGDLRQPQLQQTVRSYRVAMKTGQPAGQQVDRLLRSKKWCEQ